MRAAAGLNAAGRALPSRRPPAPAGNASTPTTGRAHPQDAARSGARGGAGGTSPGRFRRVDPPGAAAGELEFQALMRKLDRIDPSYRD